MRACASCGRTLGKTAARCLYCGKVAGDAPAGATPTRKPVLVTCPGCLRNARVAPGATGSCAFCALTFHAEDDGTARVGRASGTPAVARGHVDRLVADLPSARLWDVVRDILYRRVAYNELGAGEPERAIEALTLIATWPGDSPQWLPLSIDEAATVIPRAIFGVSDGGLVHEDGHTILLSTIGTKNRRADVAGRAATGLLDLATSSAINAGLSSLGLGFGVRVERDDDVETQSRIQLRVYLVAHQGGVELANVFNQIDQQSPTPLSVAQERELHQRIASSRSLLASYYILGALFGPSCRSGTAFSITRDAIAQRLSALGCDHSAELVDQLCIRMPSTFGR